MKRNIDSILGNVFVLLLIAAGIISLIIIGDYIGYVGYHTARGGVITNINVYQLFPAYAWHGIYGITLGGVSLNTSWFVFSNPATISEINPIFTCFEPGIQHELYVTTLNFSEINWGNITVGTTQMVDDFIGIEYDDAMSATSTFIYNITVELGDQILTDVPAAYMYQYNNFNSREFPVGILQYNGSIIMVALVNDGYLQGFRPDKPALNFEMMVPVPLNSTNLKYNIYNDPFDICPQGREGDGREPGGIYGWVTENVSGIVLESVIVAVEREIYITGLNGFYNISDLAPGNYYLVAIKQGFNNYVANVTIFEGNYTEHNITMIIYEEPMTGTGPGYGTGVGPGVDDPGDKTKTGEGPGIGPGVGPGIGPFLEKPEEFGRDHFISLDMLKKRIRLGTFFNEHLLIFSFRQEPANVQLRIVGNASKILELSSLTARIEQNQYANISILGLGLEKGEYTGYIEVSGDFNDTLPIQIIVTDEDKLPIEALLMQLDVLTARPVIGNNFRFRVNLQNLLIEENYEVKLDYYIRGIESDTSNFSEYLGNDTIELLTQNSVIKNFEIPPNWKKGEYYLIVEANYLDLYSRTSTVVEIYEPIYQYKVFGFVELWKILLFLLFLLLLIGGLLYLRYRIESKKRYHVKLEYNLLPKKGPRSLYVGKIAETELDTYIEMDKLTVHTIVAGSTGGGKTIAAQVLVEECLMKDVAVVVFDPTAQWTGMLRKCADSKMFQFYPRFHMTKKDAKAFNGNIRAIKNPREKIDLLKYLKPGEIQVFTTNTLDPKEIDIFVANTVREVFRSNLQENRELRMLMVYDEVHRLLPKFGGSGEGFIQIERACREFRKWGIGVLLVSQVLADFVGQIKANINTEIQMKTRDEGDLDRIKIKYGASFVQELVKSPVGSGMLQNSAWNRGRPYYVTFRPILHSVVRLSDDELAQYNKYNEIVDDLSYQIDMLEKQGIDVFDLKLELKLSLDKIKSGGFNMVEIYLEGLTPRIDKLWKDLGKTPPKRKVELVSAEEIKESVKAAEEDSKKAETEATEQKSEVLNKTLGLNDDVSPDKILNLSNGMLVNKLKNLVDEIKAMKKEDFDKHVSETKNDFSLWIREAIGNNEWAEIADMILSKEDYITFLTLLEQGKEKTFKPTMLRAKPFSSRTKTSAQEEVQPLQQKPEIKEASKPIAESGGEKKLQEESHVQASIKPENEVRAEQEPQKESQVSEPSTQQISMPDVQKNLQDKTPEEKIAYLEKLLQQNSNTNLKFALASEYHKSGSLDKAQTLYKEIESAEPRNVMAMYYLGNLYVMKKQFQEALELYNKILEIKPDYPKVKEYIEAIKKKLELKNA